MDKQIPIYFDAVILNTPIQEVQSTETNIGRLKVGVFTKYKNRNGSYITDEFAEALIRSATNGDTPVVGFFDPENQDWASHTGPTLANGYGYVEDFIGWEPFTDTDGITRDYAVFSVILFTKYFEEAKKIMGQHQSMELDPASIEGDWAQIDDDYYFVYTKGNILGLCVIGSHEPCFSVSAFFSKNDDNYKTQYEKFSSLLFDLKTRVEEAKEGGEQTMEDNENVVAEPVIEETPVEEPVVEFTAEEQEPAVEEEPAAEFTTKEEPSAEESEAVEEPIAEEFAVEEPSELEQLQQRYNELEATYNELMTNFSNAQEQIVSLTNDVDALRAQNENLQASLTVYENQARAAEEARKMDLIDKYSNLVDVTTIREQINDFSYNELESKLAISFAHKSMAGGDSVKVPLPDPEESQFAILMKKYRK